MRKKGLLAVVVILLAGLVGTQVYAHWFGSGWGMPGGMMGRGWGYGPMMGPGFFGTHMDYGPEVYSKESREKIEKFYGETQGMRQELQQKYLELENLLSQATPDEGKVLAKQKEISQLQAQLDEKELKFKLNNRDLAPRAGWFCAGPRMGWAR